MKKIITAILIIIWMITVFCLSNQNKQESSKMSSKVTDVVIEKLNIEVKTEQSKLQVETLIRKLAHFGLYIIGGILFFLHIDLYNVKEKNKLILALVMGLAYAISDELHQLNVFGRSGELRDIFIDFAGIITGIIIFKVLKNHIFIKNRKREV